MPFLRTVFRVHPTTAIALKTPHVSTLGLVPFRVLANTAFLATASTVLISMNAHRTTVAVTNRLRNVRIQLAVLLVNAGKAMRLRLLAVLAKMSMNVQLTPISAIPTPSAKTAWVVISVSARKVIRARAELDNAKMWMNA